MGTLYENQMLLALQLVPVTLCWHFDSGLSAQCWSEVRIDISNLSFEQVVQETLLIYWTVG